MNNVIYIQSLHRPYNQNLNSVKWVCRFIKKKNSNKEISKSDFYLEFYIYLIKKFYTLYQQSPNESLGHGIPSFESIKNSYLHIKGLSKKKKKEIIIHSISSRKNSVDRSIFSTYKASSYFINLTKDKFDFIDANNRLKERGEILNTFRSREFKLSKKEKEILFCAVLKNDFHFFTSLLLLKKAQRKIDNLSIEEIHYDFLIEQYNIRHFNFTEASQLNFSKVRDYWIKDLDILDKKFNIKKTFLDLMTKNGFKEQYKELQSQVNSYYKEKITSKSKFKKTVDLFVRVYIESPKNELGYLSLQEIADKMGVNKISFQNFINKFYELEKGKYNIYFSNIVQAISGKNQYFIRNRPIVNIKIKELNK